MSSFSRRAALFLGVLAVFSAVQLNVRPASAQGAIAFVQSAYATPQSPSASVGVLFPLAQSAGDLNVVVVGWNDATSHVQSVVDTRGNAYQLAVGPTVRAGFATQSVYYAANIVQAAAAVNTVTVTFDAPAQYADIRIAEYQGVASGNPIDVVAASQGSGTMSDSGAAITTNAYDLVVGANIVWTHTTDAGAGFTRRAITIPDGDILEDQIVNATGTYSATAPVSPAGSWIMQMVAFRAADGASASASAPPTAPGAPVPTAVSSTQINLTWPPATDDVAVTGYFVERCSGAGCAAFTQLGAAAGTSFTDSGLTAATSYSYRVRATDAAGSLGPYSASASATTPAQPQVQDAIAFVQAAYATPQSPSATVSVVFPLAQSAGNLNVVVVGWNDTTAHVQSVADALGNTYQRAAGPAVRPGFATQSIYFAANIAPATAGVNSVLVTFDAPAQYADIRIAEYQGLATDNPVDAVASSQGSGTTSDSGAVVTTNANDLLVGANMVWTGTTDAGAGFTRRAITAPDGDILEDQIVTSTGSYGATAPISPAGNWIMQMVAFRAAAPTPPPAPALPIGLVQSGYATPQSPMASVGVPFPLAQSTGNLNVVVVGWNDAAAHVQSVVDTIGNTYRLAAGPTVQAGFATQSIYYAANIAPAAAGANSVVVSFDAPAQYADIRVAEYQGLAKINPVDVVAAAQGNSTTSDSGPVVTANANDLLVGANMVWTGTTDAGAGFTRRAITVPDGDILEDQIVTAAGSYRATAPISPAGNWIMQMVALRAATSGASSGTPDLAIANTHSGTFTQGQPGAYTLTVTNTGTHATTAAVTVADVLPSGVTAAALGGDGWSCDVAALSCSRNDALTAGASYPIITLAVNVAITAPPNVSNTATVAGGGELNTSNDAAIDPTTIAPAISPPVVVAEVHSATDGAGMLFNRSTLSLDVSGANTMLLVSWHSEYDGGQPGAWTVTSNGVPGTLITQANGYTGIDGNCRFRIYYWLNPAPGANTIVVSNPTAAANELAVSAVLLSNVSQTAPLGAVGQDVSTTPRASESVTVATSPNDLVLHFIADALYTRGTLGNGETSVSVANDGGHTAPGDGDASLWIAAKRGIGASTTVSSSGWASWPSPSPRVINSVAVVVHGAEHVDDVQTPPASQSVSQAIAPPPPPLDTQAPSAPGTLTATAVSGTQVSLIWGSATDNVGVTTHVVQRCQGAGCSDFSTIATSPATTFSDTALAPNSMYTYVVLAQDGAHNVGPASNAASVTTMAISPHLIAAYAFDEGTGSVANDSSGHGNTGTIANATWTTAGKYGSALSFDGSSARVTIDDAASLHLTTAMTLEAWVNPSTWSSGWKDIVYRGPDSYYLDVYSQMAVAGLTLTPSANSNTFAPGYMPVNAWTHLAQTFDGINVTLYINGVQVAATAIAGNILASTEPLEIGSDHIFGQYFQGLIDDVRVYDVVLTPGQIQADMATPVN